jgi:hypothetical protein
VTIQNNGLFKMAANKKKVRSVSIVFAHMLGPNREDNKAEFQIFQIASP